MTTTSFIGLGSNVGDRLEHLRKAVRALDACSGIQMVRASSVYDTDPIGPPQREYLNAVVEVATNLGAGELLERAKSIERDIGRLERGRWGPREVDLDILLFGDQRIDTPDLRVPHPEMSHRAFVLVPLADLAPFARIGGGARVVELAEASDRSGVRFAHPAESLWPAPGSGRARR